MKIFKSKTKGNSSVLRFLYGKDYEHELGEGCISFKKNCKNRDRYLRLSFVMLSLNLVMAIILFPLESLYVMFTNWALEITFLGVILVTCYGQKRDINSRKGILALIHIVIEFAFAFNIVVVIIYWTFLHF